MKDSNNYALFSMCAFIITLIVCANLSNTLDKNIKKNDQVIERIDTFINKESSIDVNNEEIYAGRYDKSSSDTKYNKWGLPTDRKWLTSSEWKGKHLTMGSDKKTMFKAWKTNHMSDFLDYIVKGAQEEVSVDKYKAIPAELIVAQAIIESGFGISRLAVDANNLFGHKCHSCTDSSKFVVAHDDHIDDRFQVKSGKWESIRSHSKLLMRKYYPRIPKHRRANPDIKDWLNALCGCGRELSTEKALKAKKAGKFSYATSCYKGVGYANKIMKYIKTYRL